MNDIKGTVLIDGVTGQDGSFLSELLLKEGYRVIGLKRRTSLINTSRIDHLYNNPNFKLRYFDLSDVGSMYRLINEYKPDMIFHMGAQSHVHVSFEVPEFTVETIAMGTLRWLEAIKNCSPKTKFYNAGSSEMFGVNQNPPFNEESLMIPASPYGCAKVFSYNITKNYRNSYGLYVCSGILFNHESERRGETFVSRKISLGVARIKLNLLDYLELGNLDSSRDWGHAKDYMRAAYMMLQQEIPNDYVISTGETHTVREFCELAFKYMGLGDYQKYVKVNPKYLRPQEVPYLLGDSTKAKKELSWEPKIKFEELVKMMCDNDYNLVRQEIAAGKEKWLISIEKQNKEKENGKNEN